MIPEIKNRKVSDETVDLSKSRFVFNGFDDCFAVFENRIKKLGFGTGEKTYEMILSDDPDGKPGSFVLDVCESRCTVKAAGTEGISNALTVLFILIRDGNGTVSVQHIEDSPKYEYRGFQLDIARHFLNCDEICEIIEEMSLLRLNRCHLYLSDDYGYRLECHVHPELNRKASWRTEQDGTVYGGFLSWDDVHTIIKYAQARGMEIIPEIDMPGHTSSWIAAYPELGCFHQNIEVQTTPGISKEVLCVSRENTFSFVAQLLDEVVPLFPCEYFHIGGDEVPTDNWKSCPDCQKMKRDRNYETEWELQLQFMNRVIEYLNKKGKKIICWNDILRSGKTPENAMIHYWHEAGFEIDPAAVKPGTKFIFSYCRGFYFDFDEDLVPISNTYSYPLKYVCGADIDESNVAGFEGENWTEFTYNKAEIIGKMFPKSYALAERCWNGSGDMSHLNDLIREEESHNSHRYEGKLTFARWLADC